jgi:hypothetical protein
MKYVKICLYQGDFKEDSPYSQQVTLQKKTSEEDTTGIAHFFPDSSIVFVEAVDTEFSFREVPLEVSRFVSNASAMYEVYRRIGVENLTEFCMYKKSGEVVDLAKEDTETLKSHILDEMGSVSNITYNINDRTLSIDNNHLRCSDELDLEPIFKAYDEVVSEYE